MGIGSWNRLGEGDSIIARKMKERREQGIDIDGKIADSFKQGFEEMAAHLRGAPAPPPLKIAGIRAVGGIGPHWDTAYRSAGQAPPTPSEHRHGMAVDVVDIERNRKPVAELLAVNPPHPSEL